MSGRDIGNAALTGLAGASALFGVHQLARLATDDAPRVDVVGMRAVRGTIRASGVGLPDETSLYWLTLGSAIATDSLYYSLVAAGGRSNHWLRGVVLGVAAGLGSLLLPRRVGLGDPPKSDRLNTQVMTVAWYVIGGLAAAAAATALDQRAEMLTLADVPA